MLTITPCLEAPRVAAYCKKCKEIYSTAHYVYLAENRGEALGGCLFRVDSDNVRVMYYEAADQNDHFLFDGILRAGLNYAAEHGIENGFLPEAFRFDHRELFAKLNYPIQPLFNITNFFAKYKNCGG